MVVVEVVVCRQPSAVVVLREGQILIKFLEKKNQKSTLFIGKDRLLITCNVLPNTF